MLDTQNQILRFTDVALDVQSNAAFGLLGAAAQAAAPLLQKTLADEAVIDLKPFAADAEAAHRRCRRRIGQAESRLSANVTSERSAAWRHRLDDQTLRVLAKAYGTVDVAISSLALQ